MPKLTLSRAISKHNLILKMSGAISGSLTLLLVFFITMDVVLRYFLSKPISGANEISRVALAWIFFLGIGYAYLRGTHVQVTMLIDRLYEHKPLFTITGGVIELIVFGFLGYGSWIYFLESWGKREIFAGPVAVPFWLAKLGIPIGVVIFWIALFLNLIININSALHDLPLTKSETT